MAKKTKKAPARGKAFNKLAHDLAMISRPETPEGFLGQVVVDKLTGFAGNVVSVCYMLSGCVQGHVAPKVGEDGKLADGFFFDLDRLDVVGPGPVTPTPADSTGYIRLGFTATDRVTGCEGTLTERVVHINGCTTFVLTSKSPKKDERYITLDWKRLDLSGSKVVVPLPEAPPPGSSIRGGPTRRVSP